MYYRSLIPACLLCACGGDGAGLVDRSLIHTIRRGDLEISVREQGEIQAARDTQVGDETTEPVEASGPGRGRTQNGPGDRGQR